MKLYLPQLFAAAALAVAAFVPAYSAETTNDDSDSTERAVAPTAVHLDTDPELLESYRNNEGESYAVYLYANQKYSYKEYSTNAPMITGGDFYFTTAPENSLASLHFFNSETQAFSSIGSLTFDRLASLSFATLTGGVIDIDAGGSLTITHVDDGRGDTNSVEVRANKSSTAPVINAQGATVTLENNGNIFFNNNISGNQNTAQDNDGDGDLLDDLMISILTGLFSPNWTNEESVAYGGILQGTTVVINNNKSVSFKRNANLFDKSNGGAIYSEELTLAGNGSILFETNMATDGDGGAIYADSGDVTISDTGGAVTFTGNAATLRGGAIYAGGKKTADGEVTGGNVTISGSEGEVSFSNNASLRWGGAISANGVVMDGNASILFTGNTSKFQKGSSVGGTGGAIDVSSGGLTISNTTGKVEFSENAALLEGGAIAAYDAPVTMEKNGSILFKGNTAELSAGGAIYIVSSDSTNDAKCTVTIKGTTTGAVEFIDNSAKIRGGAIRTSGDVVLIDNKDVTFSGNNAVQSSSSNGYGGAIYAGNGKVTINDNDGTVTFSGNIIDSSSNRQLDSTLGGAIYAKSLDMRNNASAIFEKNLELRNYWTNGVKQYRLRSLHITTNASLSVAAKNSITFYDSIYIGGNLTLNETYTDAQGNTLLQTGDILFSGENTVADLEEHLKNYQRTTPSDDEILESRTSTVSGNTVLKGGCLRVEKDAVFTCSTITLAENTGATLLVKDATVKADGATGYIRVGEGASLIMGGDHACIDNQHVMLLAGSSDSYTSLKVNGEATIKGSLIMDTLSEMVLDGHLFVEGAVMIGEPEPNSNSNTTINFLLAESHRENAALSLTDKLSLMLDSRLTLGLDLASDAEEGRYRLITAGTTVGDGLTPQKFTVKGAGAASSASFADLQWENGTLYYNLEMLQWTNATGNGLWDTKTMNWQAGRTYTDGRNVKFADDGVGTVFMSGDLKAGTVSVANSTGEYVFTAADNGGRLAGDTILVKSGAGALTLASANAHTGTTLLNEGTLNLHHSDALGTSTLTAAAGTTLGVGNNAHVVLNQAGHSIAGNVIVDDGATLEIKGDAGNGYKASTSSVTGTLTFTDTTASAGILKGTVGTVQVVNSQVTLGNIDDFSGNIIVSGSNASAEMTFRKNRPTANITLQGGTLIQKDLALLLDAGGSLNLRSDVSAAKAVLENGMYLYAGATLSAGRLDVAGEQVGDTIRNSAVGGEMEIGANTRLILHYSSTLALDEAHIRLNDARLAFYVKGEDKINLNLTLDGSLTEDCSVILFSGVKELLYGEYGDKGSIADRSTFHAQDYFAGALIDENTMVTFANGVVSLSGLAIPEPSAFSLLAGLGALALVATRRRRRK